MLLKKQELKYQDPLQLYRARKGAFGQELEDLLGKLDKQTSDMTLHRRQAALEGLPIFLRENSKELFQTCKETNSEDKQTKGVQMGVLAVLEDDDAPNAQPTVINIAVVLEESIVLADLPDLPTAVAYLFGLMYALNMECPK
ncbi:unnamed protein product [Arctogadus glacialis]